MSGDRLQRQYAATTARWDDSWQLRQYLVMEVQTEGKALPPCHIHTKLGIQKAMLLRI